MSDPILNFNDEYRWLSNFWPCSIPYEGMIYPSTEHAYQASKTSNTVMRELVLNTPSPGAAKRMNQYIKVREDWSEELKLQIMLDITRIKYQHPELREKLLATGDREIIEGNSWRDRFWGVYNEQGQNHLGKILMRVRDEIRSGA